MNEPNLKNIRAFCDGRGFSYFNLFGKIGDGQINLGNLHSGVVKAFHYHNFQTDYWFCIKGDIRVICISPDRSIVKNFYIGEHNPAILEIPPGWLHGYKNVSSDTSTLLYWVTKEYDPKNPDEERVAWDFLGKELWDVENI